MSYTYDELSRVVTKAILNACDELISEEHYTYDAAGNITDAPGSCFNYDTNNRMTAFQDNGVGYDLDGNMVHYYVGGALKELEYDSANRLISAMGQEYTYNAEDTRIRNICGDEDTTYTYNTNCRLSQLLVKTTNGIVTKYVYGLGLIGEEKCEEFKTYHFDYRGSTIAVTDSNGNVTDTFKYDTYGKLTERTGTSDIIFCYNGRDGVVTEKNGLIYMRARYYSPDLRRFVNADIIRGAISDSTSLNRYAYVNGNPVSLVDPFGLSADERGQYGSIEYNGSMYPIYVPGLSSGGGLDSAWETVKEIECHDFLFDHIKFFSGIEFDDFNGVASGSNINDFMSNKQLAIASISGMFYGVFDSFVSSSNTIFISFKFQQNGDNKRVIVQAGSTEMQNMYKNIATGIPQSAYFNNSGSPFAQAVVASNSAKLYEELTGEETSFFDTYDIQVTVDKDHKKSRYSSYLWIDSNGRVMETPMLLKNDKVELGRRKGFLSMGFDSLIDLPINGSTPVSDEYQNLFNKALTGN